MSAKLNLLSCLSHYAPSGCSTVNKLGSAWDLPDATTSDTFFPVT